MKSHHMALTRRTLPPVFPARFSANISRRSKRADKKKISNYYRPVGGYLSRACTLFKADDALCTSRNFEIYRGCVSTANSSAAASRARVDCASDLKCRFRTREMRAKQIEEIIRPAPAICRIFAPKIGYRAAKIGFAGRDCHRHNTVNALQ